MPAVRYRSCSRRRNKGELNVYDVTIIGGGIIGTAIARELMRYDVRAVLVEKEVEVGFGTSKSNSGIIHGGHHSEPGTIKAKYEWPGNQMWDRLAAELGFAFKRIGELTLAFSEEEVDKLLAMKEQGEALGVPGLEIWDRDRILREEPNVSPSVVAGLYAPTTGVINPYEACFAFAGNARKNGLELALGRPVSAIERIPGGFLVIAGGEPIPTRFIVNAAGLFADEVARMAGDDTFRITGRKGEEYLLDKRLQGFVQRLLFPLPTPESKGILVIPTYDGTLMVGPTAHATEDKTDVATSWAGSDEVFSFVKRVVPGISERDCIAQFAGVRAVADGNDFIIGPSHVEGLINVAGIQSPGLTAAPAIAVDVVRMLADLGLELAEKHDFDPTYKAPVRFNMLPREEQRRLVARDPSYGKIVCRCEYVTEGEIRDAIRAGARTLDGIKFRTRAGMGRCQGGFCSWRSMQLLSEELGISMTEVTKKGGNSWLVCEFEEVGS